VCGTPITGIKLEHHLAEMDGTEGEEMPHHAIIGLVATTSAAASQQKGVNRLKRQVNSTVTSNRV
jgi:hypothetical protein